MTPEHPERTRSAGRTGRRRRVLAWGGAVAVVLAVAGGALWLPDKADDGVGCLAVGAHVQPGTSGSHLATFVDTAKKMGPLTMRRSFDPALPSSFRRSDAGSDAAGGLRSFVSWKPPHGDHAGAARGKYDDEITAWARSVPRTGVYATAFHEPENDMTAEEFVAMQRHLYEVVKRANDTIHWGPVYMAYWWDPAQPSHYVGDPAAWWPGDDHADFAGLDWYGVQPRPMTSSPDFRHWYRFMAATGKPLAIPEYGQYVLPEGARPDPRLQRLRADAIRADAAWIQAHPQIRVWLYWQDVGPEGDWAMTDAVSQGAWRAVARAGCPA